MTPTEALDLLSMLAIFDRREVNAAVARGWAWALEDVPLPLAIRAAKRAQQAGGYVDIQAVQRELRAMRADVERDVRSAKARGIVPESWDPRKPLTGELEQRLHDMQTAEWEATNDRPEELSPVTGRTAALGVGVKGLPS